jgi:hypothetical protein
MQVKVTLTRTPFAFTMLTMNIRFAGFFRPDHDPPQMGFAFI